VSPEGDINQAKAEPVEETTSALQNEYTSVQLARADFGVTPDQTITRPPADTYYVNNGDQPQPWKANPNNSFVPPGENRTSDPYYNPNANQQRQWRAKPFEDGGTQFRRPGDPQIIAPQDQRDPTYRPQVIPNQTYVPDQQYIPGYVAPNQQFDAQNNPQFNPQYNPEYRPQFISNNGLPAFSGMGLQFTNNFYNVGERPPLTFTNNMTFVPKGTDIPAIKINTAFPGQNSFFGVPLNRTTDGVVTNPTNIVIPKGDTLPLNNLPAITAPVKFNPGVVPVDTKVDIPLVSDAGPNLTANPNLTGLVAADQTERVVVNPITNTISNDLSERPLVAATDNLTLPAAQTTAGVEVKPVTNTGDQTLVAGDPTRPATTLPFDSKIPASNVLVPIDQKTQDRAVENSNNRYNETYRYVTTVPALATYALAGGLPKSTQGISTFASKWTNLNINPNINISAKFRDPAGAIVGLNAYEGLHKLVTWGNAPDSVVGNVTVPAGILAYRALAPNATYKGLGTMVMAGTAAATFYGDKLIPSGAKDTPFGTHTAFDDGAMVTGMYLANALKTPAALTKWTVPTAVESMVPATVAKAIPGALGSGLWKVGVLAGTFVAGNMVESAWNYFFPGTKTLTSRAQSAMDADSTERTEASLAKARQSFSDLSDSQWSAAQAEYVKVKAESDALVPGKDSWEKLAIANRKVMILGAAVGENYLNNGTQVTNKGNTFLGKGSDIDLNSQAMIRLSEARNSALNLIREYTENVIPEKVNGTAVNKAAEVEALKKEYQRITGLMERIYAPHDFEKALPEFVKAANEKPQDFFTNFVRANSDMANTNEQNMKSRGVWDNPDYREDRRAIAKMHRDKAFALMVLAQRALDTNGGREAVTMMRGPNGQDTDPGMNARSALNTAIVQLTQMPERSQADINNINALKAMYARLNAQIKAKFPMEYSATR